MTSTSATIIAAAIAAAEKDLQQARAMVDRGRTIHYEGLLAMLRLDRDRLARPESRS